MTSSPPSGTPPAEPTLRLDLRGTPCPLNFIRSRLALERIAAGEWMQLELDAGEPELMVAEGLRQEGHRVERVTGANPEPHEAAGQEGVRLWIRRHGD
ncbi:MULTISPECIES: sulfurtransferase TusA family protein [unclassified Synechococcus]|uniref:sulfurtransferase TusA family protein n=1 Tax=unclassified Synechococcus TaxID=2626047 RepID=UPI0000698376|nr:MULTISPECIES: sulfurtransferase TusA family protein [unclassified Synechococcus]EAQ75743.1 hypothetical protein WH5701_02819 [Synechococcus sp. WH 5701]WFN59593.1 sulfurtransferase TusA family protein [Synechococcus sp. CCFWC 502]